MQWRCALSTIPGLLHPMVQLPGVLHSKPAMTKNDENINKMHSTSPGGMFVARPLSPPAETHVCGPSAVSVVKPTLEKTQSHKVEKQAQPEDQRCGGSRIPNAIESLAFDIPANVMGRAEMKAKNKVIDKIVVPGPTFWMKANSFRHAGCELNNAPTFSSKTISLKHLTDLQPSLCCAFKSFSISHRRKHSQDYC